MNRLALAVAGGRKTQSVVEACANGASTRRILVLGYTQASQRELEERIRVAGVRLVRLLAQEFRSPVLATEVPRILAEGLQFRRRTGSWLYGERGVSLPRFGLPSVQAPPFEAGGGRLQR